MIWKHSMIIQMSEEEGTDPLTLNYAQHSPLGKVDECNGGLVSRQVDLI